MLGGCNRVTVLYSVFITNVLWLLLGKMVYVKEGNIIFKMWEIVIII